MSTRIGGPHKCNIHPEFETEDTNEFNEHCRTTEGHSTTGVYTCDCGTQIEVTEIPFQEIGKETKLQCPNCFNNNQELNKLVNSQQQIQQQNQQSEVVEVGGEGA